jgi:hypothetical protein
MKKYYFIRASIGLTCGIIAFIIGIIYILIASIQNDAFGTEAGILITYLGFMSALSSFCYLKYFKDDDIDSKDYLNDKEKVK